jgi:hypothetical protein
MRINSHLSRRKSDAPFSSPDGARAGRAVTAHSAMAKGDFGPRKGLDETAVRSTANFIVLRARPWTAELSSTLRPEAETCQAVDPPIELDVLIDLIEFDSGATDAGP